LVYGVLPFRDGFSDKVLIRVLVNLGTSWMLKSKA
jgi:hypothetical protein